MRKTLEGATSELCSRTVRHRTLRETSSRTCGVTMSGHVSQQLGFKPGGLRHLGAIWSESTTVGSLIIMVQAGNRAGAARTATALH